jgi:lipoprotein-releasing system ATP-binding protein
MNKRLTVPVSPAEANEPCLVAEDLKKSFSGGGEVLTILNGLNLTVEEGQSLAVLGASGSGKSTLLYFLGGLDKPTGGRILSRGGDIFKLNEAALAHWRAKEVGFVFQYHHLLPEFDALENVSMPALLAGMTSKEAGELAEPLLLRVGLGSRQKHRPGALSGGEQQRVALARALIMSPKILLADEPTGNLDAQNAALVNDLIGQLVAERKMSTVVVTHNADLARQMKRRLELFDGQLRPWSG